MTRETPAEPVAIALGLLVRHPAWSDRELEAALETELVAANTGPHVDVARVLGEARARWSAFPAAFYPCAGSRCRAAGAQRLPWVTWLGAGSACAVLPTGCQGPCDHGPMAALRVGDRLEHFRHLADEEAARELARFALRAAAAETLLVDPGQVAPLRFDPLHGHAAAHLLEPIRPLAFLAGRFRGRGGYAESDGVFFKELSGRWEARGRALSLRMAVSFPTANGCHDSHEALVIVAPTPDGRIVGRAYEDGGAIREYEYEVAADGGIVFDDRPPGHGHGATRARKRLVPVRDGYEEILEVEGGGRFEIYSRVRMRRLGPHR